MVNAQAAVFLCSMTINLKKCDLRRLMVQIREMRDTPQPKKYSDLRWKVS